MDKLTKLASDCVDAEKTFKIFGQDATEKMLEEKHGEAYATALLILIKANMSGMLG